MNNFRFFGGFAWLLFIGTVVAAEINSTITTNDKTIANSPIIIETQVQHYDEPNLQEYMQCHESRDQCLQVCASHANVPACESECPTCPLLVSHDVLVQGVNDTAYREPVGTPVNTTNVIKITNAIHNVIDNTKNITARNENNVHIYHTNSTRGGRFGLGYNENGPCCLVVRDSAKCNSSPQRRCHQKRHRVCGERCKAREIYAKRVLHCAQGNESASSEQNCHEGFQYVPYRRHQPRVTSSCRYMATWPYVACGARRRAEPTGIYCRRCLQLPYGYILRHGMPSRCMMCYGQSSAPSYTPPGMWYGPSQVYAGPYGPYMPPPVQWTDDFATNGWKVDEVKCRLPDGTISQDCETDENTKIIDEPEMLPTKPEDPLGYLPEAQEDTTYEDEYNDYDTYDAYDENDNDLNGVEAMRRRRHSFRRSSYSRRND